MAVFEKPPSVEADRDEKSVHISILRILAGMVVLSLVPMFGLLIARGPVDGTGDTGDGYWGAKTANVNWCEADYAVTRYIAEFGNSISSFGIVLVGLYGLYMHRKSVEPRYLVAFCFIIIVGLGSAAFHGTLWRSMQLLDELPMIWANAVFIYILAAMEDAKTREPRTKEICILAMATLLVTVSIVLFDTEDQTFFLVAYGGTATLILLRSKWLDLKYNSRGTVLLLETTLLFYCGGLLLWLIDRNFCPTVRSLYLHALWHLGAGMGTFTAVLFWIWVRYESLGMRPQVRGSTPPTRWVELPVKLV